MYELKLKILIYCYLEVDFLGIWNQVSGVRCQVSDTIILTKSFRCNSYAFARTHPDPVLKRQGDDYD